jgi:nucleoside-diphosphate-sugar epimerase
MAVCRVQVCFSHCFPIPHGWFADAQKQLIGPALKGTESLLRSVTAVGKAAVRRVILTSSVAAVRGAGSISKSPGGCFNEGDWNEKSSPTSSETMDLTVLLKPLPKRLHGRSQTTAGLNLQQSTRALLLDLRVLPGLTVRASSICTQL